MTTMSKLDAPDTSPDKPKRKVWVSAAVGGIAGFTLTYIGFQLGSAGSQGEPLIAIGISEIAAIALGASLLMCAAIVALGTVWPRVGIAMTMFEDIEQWEDERPVMGLSVVGCFAYGLAMILLALVEPLGWNESIPVMVAIAALALVFVFTAWRLLKHYDELWTGVNSETCVTAMYLTFAIGGGWSVLAHLGFIPALAALDWITLLGATSLVGAMHSTYRRGMIRT